MKKQTLIIVTAVLCAAMLAGCATPAAETSASVVPSESAEASEPAAAANTDYMSWTGAEWDAANSDEQFAAAEAVLLKVGDAMMSNYGELVEQAKSDETVKAQIDEQVESLKSSIATFFKSSPEATLSDLVAASTQAVESLGN